MVVTRTRSRRRAALPLQGLAPCAGLLALSLATSLGAPPPARAHAIESTLVRLQALSNTLQVESHFSTGVPVDGAQVRLVSPDGKDSIALGQTDRSGSLRFQLPSAANSSWELQVDGGGGHRDYLELPTATGTGPQALTTPTPPTTPAHAPASPLPLGLLLLGMVSGGWIWSRQRR